MKVIKAQATANKTASTIDLSEDLKGIPRSEREDVLSSIGELLVEQVLVSASDQQSPVEGYGTFEKLSKDYAKHKKDEVGNTKPNLDLSGDMLNALEFKVTGNRIELGVYGSEAPKADGHNNFSGKSKLPTRRFLPADGESFDSSITELVMQEINNRKADSTDLDPKRLEEIDTKKELIDYLMEETGIKNKSAMIDSVLSSNLRDVLDAYDLLDLID